MLWATVAPDPRFAVLAQRIHEAAEPFAPAARPPRSGAPHVTLVRHRGQAPKSSADVIGTVPVAAVELVSSLLGPGGSHPILDPLFSSESLTIEHDSPAEGRLGKVRFLVAERPELLPYLKVCQTENTSGNCGRCRKCMWTMTCLQAAGALERADSFPDVVDLDAVRGLRLEHYIQRALWTEAAGGLGDSEGDRALRSAIHRYALGRAARPSRVR